MPRPRGEMPVALSGTSCPFERGEVNLHERVRVYGSFDHRICARTTTSPIRRMRTSGGGWLAGVYQRTKGDEGDEVATSCYCGLISLTSQDCFKNILDTDRRLIASSARRLSASLRRSGEDAGCLLKAFRALPTAQPPLRTHFGNRHR